jgi:hypothetical protein
MLVAITLDRSPTLRIWSEIIEKSFAELGFQTVILEVETLDQMPDCDICFVLFPHRYPRFQKRKNTFYVCWQFELMPSDTQPVDHHLKHRFDEMCKYYDFYDMHLTLGQDKANFMSRKGYKFFTLDYGFSDLLMANMPICSKEYDVLFYGTMSQRRERIVRQLANKGISIHPNHSFLCHKHRTTAWSQAKIVLNLHFTEQKSFEIERIINCLANGLFVISEETSERHEFGSNLVFSNLQNMSQTINTYLLDTKARDKMVKKGQRFVHRTSMTKNLEKVLGEIHRNKIRLL